MEYTHITPTEAGFYWYTIGDFKEPKPMFIQDGATQAEVLSAARREFLNATGFYWYRHAAGRVTDEATAFLVANKDFVITQINHNIADRRVYFIKALNKSGVSKTFGIETSEIKIGLHNQTPVSLEFHVNDDKFTVGAERMEWLDARKGARVSVFDTSKKYVGDYWISPIDENISLKCAIDGEELKLHL
jgi:hypothetical protein